jgi:hypothetical protein
MWTRLYGEDMGRIYLYVILEKVMLHSPNNVKAVIADPDAQLLSAGFLNNDFKGMPKKVGFPLEAGFLNRIIPQNLCLILGGKKLSLCHESSFHFTSRT